MLQYGQFRHGYYGMTIKITCYAMNRENIDNAFSATDFCFVNW